MTVLKIFFLHLFIHLSTNSCWNLTICQGPSRDTNNYLANKNLPVWIIHPAVLQIFFLPLLEVLILQRQFPLFLLFLCFSIWIFIPHFNMLRAHPLYTRVHVHTHAHTVCTLTPSPASLLALSMIFIKNLFQPHQFLTSHSFLIPLYSDFHPHDFNRTDLIKASEISINTNSMDIASSHCIWILSRISHCWLLPPSWKPLFCDVFSFEPSHAIFWVTCCKPILLYLIVKCQVS